jgi:hypothetical protein
MAVVGCSPLRELWRRDSAHSARTSWGVYLTSILAGVDPRFKFAVPV